MTTLLEILQKTTGYLAGKGVANPKLNAELLLAHVLKLRRLDLYLQFDRPLNTEQLDALRPLVQRRGKREPLEYIVGNRPFADIELLCDRRALVPRSETEELVELLADRFSSTATQAGNATGAESGTAAQPANTGKPATPAQVLDLGTGTGALALALAKIWPQATVTAVDASADALALARANAEHNHLTGRTAFVRANWFAPPAAAEAPPCTTNPEAPSHTADPEASSRTADAEASPSTVGSSSTAATPQARRHIVANATTGASASPLAGRHFDLIVSNPPYLTEAEWQSASAEVKDWEPYGALVAPEDGLADLRHIVVTAPQFLAPGGLLALETGIAHHAALAQIAAATGAYTSTESHCDSDGRPRFFIATT